MENIIKKAIEGGWNPNKIELSIPQNKDWFIKNVDKKKTILDPLFWQSLGKACGWNTRKHSFSVKKGVGYVQINYQDEQMSYDLQRTDIYYALQFHEINLTEGWDAAVKWLNEIICK